MSITEELLGYWASLIMAQLFVITAVVTGRLGFVFFAMGWLVLSFLYLWADYKDLQK